MSSPRQDPKIQELIRLRDAANALCSEFTELEFRDERGWLDEQEKARLAVVSDAADEGRDALRQHLLSLRSEHATVLAGYYSYELKQAELVAARNPDDRYYQIKVEMWQRVVAGETDDIIFERILSE
jgi:hypothetical protein